MFPFHNANSTNSGGSQQQREIDHFLRFQVSRIPDNLYQQNFLLNSNPQPSPQISQPFLNQALLLFGQTTNIHQQNIYSQNGVNTIYNQNIIQHSIQGDDDEIVFNIQNDENHQFYDLDNNIKFDIKTLQDSIKLSKTKQQQLPGMITIKTKEEEQQPNILSRVGVDLICLIDKSGSMQGEKMKMVKQTLNVLLDFLTEKDRLQLITFESKAEQLTPLKIGSDANKQQMKEVIEQIQAQGGTNIKSATQIAFQSLKNRKQKNHVTCIFILSDGQDKSAENQIKKQINLINEIFTIHSFGFGADHDSKMMSALCNLGKGSFYFVQNIQLLDEFFADAFGGLISVVGKEIEIEIKSYSPPPFENIHLSKTSKVWVCDKNKKDYSISIPYISSGSSKDYVFEIIIPKFNGIFNNQNRNVLLMETTLKLKHSINGQQIQKKAQLYVQFLNEEEKIYNIKQDIQVLAQQYRVQAIEIIEQAQKKCDQMKYQEASKLIEDMIVKIKSDKEIAKLCEGILQDLQQAQLGSSKQTFRMFGQQQMIQLVSNNYNQSGVSAYFRENGLQIQQPIQQMYQNQCSFNMMQMVQNLKLLEKNEI